jgi:hypothetical protein
MEKPTIKTLGELKSSSYESKKYSRRIGSKFEDENS